jgi:dTMP kinase
MPLLIFEGIDGSGKSTLSKALAHALDAHRVAFPSTEGPVGRLIRSTFTGETTIDKRAMQHLFIADALDQDPDISRRTSVGETVICDRHPTISGWVYQVETTPIDFVQQISIAHCFQAPDFTFIIDVPPAVALARLAARGGADQGYEQASLELVDQRRSRYMAYNVMHPNCMLLDGQLPVLETVGFLQRFLAQRQALAITN